MFWKRMDIINIFFRDFNVTEKKHISAMLRFSPPVRIPGVDS